MVFQAWVLSVDVPSVFLGQQVCEKVDLTSCVNVYISCVWNVSFVYPKCDTVFFFKKYTKLNFPSYLDLPPQQSKKQLKTKSKLWRKQEYWITWWEFIIVTDGYAPKFSAKQYNLLEYISHKPKNCSGVISLAISCRLVTWCWRRNLGHTCISSGSAKPLFSIPSQTQNNGPHNLKSEMQCNYMFRDSHPQAKPGQVPVFSKTTPRPIP